MQNNGQIRRILDADRIFIYGTGFMGKALKKCLTEAPFRKVISGFVVESRENNPDDIDGIPVMDVAEATIHRDELVLVALHEMHIANVMRVLQEQAFSNVMVMSFDSDLWSEIRGRWFRVNMPDSIFVNESLGEGEGKAADLSVYVVHSIYDRELAEKTERQSFEVPIQVGAALTDKKLFTVRDDTGENISEKNRQYCELTALYWMWKNDNSKYVGLSHYRRKFELNGTTIEDALKNIADVLVTTPIINFNTLRCQYGVNHDIRDWDVLIEGIGKLYPEYMPAADTVQKGIYYYAYNMFITRKEIFDAYCEWLFPILEYCEKQIGTKENGYQNRYLGFLAERMLTIYLTHNSHLRAAIVPKHFIECK